MTELTAQEAYDEAVRRIRAWQPDEVLDLAINGLTKIPECIGEIEPTELLLTIVDDQGDFVGVTQLSDLSPLAGLTSLKSLDCGGTQVSDLGPLAGLSALQTLNCVFTKVSDLGPLSALIALRDLDCSETQVSDLSPLSELTALQSVTFEGTPVSDLSPLSELTALQSVTFEAAPVSDLSPLSKLTALQTVNCSETQVSDLSPLSKLTALQELDCVDTQVSDLGPLSELTALRDLDCSYCNVSDLAPLSGLTALRTFYCSGTQVRVLAHLSGLIDLQVIYCSGTQVRDLGPLSRLSALRYFDCSDTPVSDLGPLSALSALQSLNCSGTQVSDLSALSGLSALRYLNCDGTQVRDLVPLSTLANLTRFDAYACEITEWPQELFCRKQITLLSLSRLSGIPSEVLSVHPGNNCAKRLRAHLLDLGPDPVALGDAKLLVLGNGRVGKTQLSRTLMGDGYDPAVDSTHGIVVRNFDLAVGTNPEPRIQLWDFGGQDIYHSTHTMFMKSRGMYLLAWTPEHEDNDTHVVGGHTFRNHQLPYWLNQIRAFAGKEAPLIVVQTQVDTLCDRQSIPEYAKEAYDAFSKGHPNALPIHHSAKTGRGQADLNEALRKAHQSIDKPLIGKTRFAVKRALEDMISEGSRRTMPSEEFTALCDTHGGVTRPDLFLETLHNAGVVFYRDGFYSGEIILDQQWAITAIYSVLERGKQTFAIIQSMQGKFQQALLGGLQWDQDGYSPYEQDLFIGMMEACGICFKYEWGTEHIPATYIAPDLLPETASPSWDGLDAGATQTRTYRAHPAALIRSVICAIGAAAGTKGEFWRSGLCVFEGSLQGWVRIEIASENVASPQIILRTSGAHAAGLLERVEEIVVREEGRLGFTAVECEGPSPKRLPKVADDRKEATLSYTRPKDEDSGWFFSYAQADERADKSHPVATFCGKVEREQGVKIRRDVNELQVGEAIEPFMRELSKGARIYIWLTDAYLKSPFCMFELHEIWKRSEKEAKDSDAARSLFDERVEIILGDANIRLPTEIAAYRKFWNEQFAAISEEIEEMVTVDDLTIQTRNAINIFKSQTGSILRYVGSRLRETSFDELI